MTLLSMPKILIRDGDDSYLITGGGMLSYHNGKVERL